MASSRLSGSTDATGEVDYGNIDAFVRYGETYSLEGDWGELDVVGGRYRLVLD